MSSSLLATDLVIFACYLLALVVAGIWFAGEKVQSTQAYFLNEGKTPAWLAAISVLATTQSAATFLGGPEYGYHGDFTYLGANLGAIIAALLVGRIFMPRLYAIRARTVYELLEVRFGRGAMRSAGLAFVLGRILAGGARLYLASLALSMLFARDMHPPHIAIAAALVVAISLLLTLRGGLHTVLWLDVLQVVTYLGGALALLIFLLHQVAVPWNELLSVLRGASGGADKLRLFDMSLSFDRPFALPAILTGITLLNVANFALDHDTTQRLLACPDARTGTRGLYLSVMATIPAVALFIAIGTMLFVYYRCPELIRTAARIPMRDGELTAGVTVFLRFILDEAPVGLRGWAAGGVAATAIGTTMSALNAMASVLVEDFYRPWRRSRTAASDAHFVVAGRVSMGLVGIATWVVAIGSFYWQRWGSTSVFAFALGIMNFAYAGLLGVYFSAIYTRRGNTRSVYAALVAGFLIIACLQPAIWHAIGGPRDLLSLSFPWQLCIGAMTSFAVCIIPRASGASAPSAARP